MAALGGVDLGATHLRAAVADAADAPLARERRPTPGGVDGPAVARAAAECLEAAAAKAGRELPDLDAVGVGTVGPLARADGAVVRPPNLAGVDRIPLRDSVADRVGHDLVFVENDTVAGLLGERAAAGDPPANLVYLTLSTGIGAGVAVDGHVLRGRGGNAAEVGHLVVDPDGRRTCGCGRPGHWEAYCSGRAIPGLARDVAAATGVATGLGLDDPGLAAADVFEAAPEDPLAADVVNRVARYNAIGVAGLVHAFAPDVVSVGGAVALENAPRLVEPLRDAAAEYAMLPVPEVRPAVHGYDAVLRGSLALAAGRGLDG